MSLTFTVRDFCLACGFPLKEGDRVLCAVSGGTDSMALLHYLWKLGCRVTAATFDHSIRPDSGEDVAFVRRWCAEREIPFVAGKGDVPREAGKSGETLEEAARRLRYAFLKETAEKVDAFWIATAHNADDQAETVLLRLLRGTGLKGLGGIPPRRGNIIRPFLPVTREEIELYAQEYHIPHREDVTNQDTAYTRNFLRQEVLPLLKSRNPNLARTLCRTADSLRQDGQLLETETDLCVQGLLTKREGEVSVPAEELLELPEPIALRLLGRMSELLDEKVILSHDQRKALLSLAKSQDPSAKISLPSRLQGKRVYDMLTLCRLPKQEGGFQPVQLAAGGTVAVPELGVMVACKEVQCPQQREKNSIYLSTNWETLTIRPRRDGDRFQQPGRPEKRLKKLFMEAKIPKEQRDSIPVLEINGEIAAVAGFGAGSQYQVVPGQAAWQITITCTEREGVTL